MQIEISANAIRFLTKLVPSLMLRPDNQDFLPDAQAITELLSLIAPKEENAPSDLQS